MICNYVIKDYDGKVLKDISGVISIGSQGIESLPLFDIPTHGSISLEVKPNTWLNFKTSEWLTITLSGYAVGWEVLTEETQDE